MLMANQDQNLNYAWQVQKLGATAGQTGYGQNGVTPAVANVSAAEQASSGASAAPAPTAVAEVLTNPGYASSPAFISPGAVAAALVPVPATTVAFQNPTGLNCQVAILTGTLTVISVAPLVNGAAGTFTQVGTTAPANISVPPGGFIKMTFSVAPTWTWIATN
jgi:hypothetical protein